MIVAKVEDLFVQIPALKGLERGLHFILDARDQALADGRIEVDGDRVYVLVQSYDTVPAAADSKFEAHRRYIDIQYIAEGREGIGYARLSDMTVTKEYNPDKDVVNGTVTPDACTVVKLEPGMAGIFFPEDAHAPKLALGTPGAVKKIVVKVLVGA